MNEEQRIQELEQKVDLLLTAIEDARQVLIEDAELTASHHHAQTRNTLMCDYTNQIVGRKERLPAIAALALALERML